MLLEQLRVDCGGLRSISGISFRSRQREACSPPNFSTTHSPRAEIVRWFVILLDWRLTWCPHITHNITNRKQATICIVHARGFHRRPHPQSHISVWFYQSGLDSALQLGFLWPTKPREVPKEVSQYCSSLIRRSSQTLLRTTRFSYLVVSTSSIAGALTTDPHIFL